MNNIDSFELESDDSFLIRIERASSDSYWYAEDIGLYYKVTKHPTRNDVYEMYHVPGRFIDIADCVKI